MLAEVVACIVYSAAPVEKSQDQEFDRSEGMMLTLDGTRGKEIDLVLRTALTLSLLTGTGFEVSKLRRGQPNPGLETQHLYLLKALLRMTDSQVDGLMPGAMSLRFKPGQIRGERFHIEFGTTGLVTAALPTLIPVCMFAAGPVICTINGGADVCGEMNVDWWEHVLLPFLRPYANEIDLQVRRRGYYSQGGGQIRLHCIPDDIVSNLPKTWRAVPPLDIVERGAFRQVHVISRAVAPLRAQRVAERQAGAFFTNLGVKDPAVQIRYSGDANRGTSITAWAEYAATRLGTCVIGEPGRTATDVGKTAAQQLQREMNSDATVDRRTAEILVPWIALLGGNLQIDHFSARMEAICQVTEQFLPGLLSVQGKQIRGKGRGPIASDSQQRMVHQTGQLTR